MFGTWNKAEESPVVVVMLEDSQAVGSGRCTRAVSEHLVVKVGAVEKQIHGTFQLVSARTQSDYGRDFT